MSLESSWIEIIYLWHFTIRVKLFSLEDSFTIRVKLFALKDSLDLKVLPI
jgi:hypothetical protein